MKTPIISIVGWHKVGKTTLVVQLLAELKRMGLRVATIKHTHGEFQLDREGTDTWRYAEVGSDCVVIAGRERAAFLARTEHELSLDELIARLPSEVDLIVTEGFKQEPTPKIEVLAPGDVPDRVGAAGELIAIVADDPPTDVKASGVPCYGTGDVAGLVELLVARGLIALPGAR
ncbi:MAG: molybdopterin-guanine dinucleotide biosynthesis protein B [Chloroflexi bacterium]|nr:molybdopterin-guanine dinucleotide biosynthesis protein B [Chloroflexota bacterium]